MPRPDDLGVTVEAIKHFQFQARRELEQRRRRGDLGSTTECHAEYQGRPVDWIVDKLGVPRETIEWSLHPEYQECYCPECEKKGNAGQPHIWDGDKDPLVKALNEVAEGKSIAVSSGTSTSKTFTIAAAGTLYVLACYENSIVLNIAPKQELLLKNAWKEIGKFWPKFRALFPQATILTGSLRMLPGEGQKEVWTATAFGAGVGAEEEVASRLKGFHGARMLWILEELQGIDAAMVETIVKTATGSWNPIAGLGNPEHQHDPLALFGKRDWVTAIRISALDFPNVVCGREIIPGGRTRESIARDLADADGDEMSPLYLSQVRGIAPAQSKRALIRWEWCEAAASRFNDQGLRQGALALGVDPADKVTGDSSAISRWQGACCTEVESFKAEDASEVGRAVFREIRNPYSPINPRYVGIDSVGVGASTVNELRRLGVRVRHISGGMKAIPGMDHADKWSEQTTDEDGNIRPAGPTVVDLNRYVNTRSQVYWILREDLRLGRIAIPKDPKLWEELTAIEYDEPNGQVAVEPKDKIRPKLGGRSPDRADALAYGNFVRPRRPERMRESVSIPPPTHDQDTRLEQYIARAEKQKRKSGREAKKLLKKLRKGAVA